MGLPTTEGKGVLSETIEKLYGTALPSVRSGLFFNTYPYPTKIAPESIAVYIAAHTKPGDTVLDAFSGSGSTGIAAMMCEHPTKAMLSIADNLGVNPQWGARNAILYDISTYAAFASSTMAHPPSASRFVAAAHELLHRCSESVGWLYNAKGPDGRDGTIRQMVWTTIVRCPSCHSKVSFYDGMVSWNPVKIAPQGMCPRCGSTLTTTCNDFVVETSYDPLLGHTVTQRERVPALVYGTTDGGSWKRAVASDDLRLINKVLDLPYPSYSPVQEIEWGELHRAGYHKGISHLHHFYTKRNFLVMSELWHQISSFPDDLQNALRLWVLSYNESNSTLMTRVVAKKGSKDFVMTSAQSGVLYISNLPVEKNILLGLERKIKPFAVAFDYLDGCTGEVTVRNQSSTSMSEPDESVDYAFSDPPFGGFIPYSEVNQINELWLGSTTKKRNEAIISSSQGKGVDEYESLLEGSLAEMSRVLKNTGVATLVFHASKADVWNAFERAIHDAGLHVAAASYLDKSQPSFKQVVSPGSVRNDSLVLLTKGGSKSSGGPSTHVKTTECKNDKRLAYTMYVNNQLVNGAPITLDAQQAYDLYEERIFDD